MKRWVNISNTVEITNNRVKPFKGERCYLATGDLIGDAVNESIVSVDYENKPSRADLLVEDGNIIVARMQTTNKVLLIDKSTEDLIVSTGFLTLQPQKDFDGSYLAHYFQSDVFQKQKDKYCSGATQKAINNGAFAKLQVPSYSLDEQKRISNILDQADALRQKRKQSVQLLDDFLRATFLDMFGDPVINEKGWELRKLPKLISKEENALKRGPFGGALKKEIFVEKGYLVYEQYHALNNDYTFKRYFINHDTFNTLKAFEVKSGDILISCSGVYLGKLSIVPPKALPGIINQALLKVSLDTNIMLQVYFVYLFSHPSFKAKYIISDRGSGIPNLPPMSVMRNIDFITPAIEIQRKFVLIVEQVEQTKQKMFQSLNELDSQLNALTQRYFG